MPGLRQADAYLPVALERPRWNSGLTAGGSLVVYGNNSALISVAGPASIVTADVWSHYALTRYGNVWTCWFNGVAHSTVTYSGSLATTGTWDVGGPGAINRWIGYIDDFRLTIGNARYTAAFTPPDRSVRRFPAGQRRHHVVPHANSDGFRVGHHPISRV